MNFNFPDFYFIIIFSFVSFVIGYLFAFFSRGKETIEDTPSDNSLSEDHQEIIDKNIETISKPKESKELKSDYLDIESIVPGQIRATKTYDRNGKKENSEPSET